MLDIGFPAPGIDDPEEAVVGFFIDDDIIDDATLIVEEKTVKSAADRGFGQVIGESVIGEFVSLRARDAKTAHMADVEKSGAGAGGFVLEKDPLIVRDRHPPTVEIHKFGAV